MHKYNIYTTLSGLFSFIIVSVICILGLRKPFLGFTFAFSAKYITEIIYNLIIINYYGIFVTFVLIKSDPNPLPGSFSLCFRFSFKDYIKNLWYPFTVAISDVTVFISINFSFLTLFYFLLKGKQQEDALQVTNVYIELLGLCRKLHIIILKPELVSLAYNSAFII